MGGVDKESLGRSRSEHHVAWRSEKLFASAAGSMVDER